MPYRSLKAYRRANHLSQRDAAALVRVTQSEWSRIERGQRRPHLPLAKRIAKRTGMSLLKILGVDG